MRTRRWKYIRRFHDYPHPVLSNCDDSATKQLWVEHGWGEQVVPEEQLYDLIFDPNEAASLHDSAEHAEVLRSMRERLVAWMRETDDPLLDGPIPLPPGAVVNDASQSSPNEPLRAVPAKSV